MHLRRDDTKGVATSLGAALAIALSIMGPPTMAAAPPAADTENRPIEIQADSGIEWQQEAQVYIARGHAVAKRGTSEVHADTLTAHYRPTKDSGNTGANSGGNAGGTEIYRVDADGNVTLKGETQTVTGDKAVYDVDQAIVVVTGKDLKMTTATDVVTARDSLEWYDQKQIAVARGDALAVRDLKRIRADVLTAYMVKPGAAPAAKSGAKPAAAAKPAAKPEARGPLLAGNGQISRVDAQGHVLVSTSTDVGRGDFGVYNAQTGIATLLGNVTLTRGENAIRGQYAVMDLNNNVSRMMNAAGQPGGRVQGLFVRQQQPTPDGGEGKPAAAKKP
jgi:lipopolysaccharide export system protein LptA